MTIAVVGLGYVGLPLAIEFGKKIETIGFDISADKISNLQRGVDQSGEVCPDEFRAASKLTFSELPAQLSLAEIIIVAVPTPIDHSKMPDLSALEEASSIVGRHMTAGTTVVFESTVYPGATEEICIPILEKESDLRWKRDFFVGYSPERINPGDPDHSLTKIVKVISGDCTNTVKKIADYYGLIVQAGLHEVSSIKVAEACKVIENTQRDINIALMNELSMIFNIMKIDTNEVIEAASTKWNFNLFKPGLVGGHCIGVDPYYLTFQAKKMGFEPEMILSGRRINDHMSKYVASEVAKKVLSNGGFQNTPKCHILGATFKENCADMRNSKILDLYNELKSFGLEVLVSDPFADPKVAIATYGSHFIDEVGQSEIDALILAVPHRTYTEKPVDELVKNIRDGGWVIDIKSALTRETVEDLGLNLWSL